MDRVEFGHEDEKTVYGEYRSQIRALEERLARLEVRVIEAGESPRYKAAVSKLRAFKGIDYIIALAAASGIGGFRRFAGAKEFMSYLGFVPSEGSGGGKRKQGGHNQGGERASAETACRGGVALHGKRPRRQAAGAAAGAAAGGLPVKRHRRRMISMNFRNYLDTLTAL
jgi:transposase